MRGEVIAANWKMNMDVCSAWQYLERLKKAWKPSSQRVVIFPPFTLLWLVGMGLQGTGVELGAQDVFWEATGSFTGEVSPLMIKEIGCNWVIVGHSERRNILLETDQMVAKKARAAVDNGLTPIICVGESWEEKQSGLGEAKLRHQVNAALSGFSAHEVDKLVIAYEPIWAIGTGRAAAPEDAAWAASLIRGTASDLWGDRAAARLRVLYGGSVKPATAGDFGARPELDGMLVGGASLNPHDFAGVISGWAERRRFPTLQAGGLG
ncbi:MAG: triose-phosphate isomerase [Bacillota bacterium]